MNTPAFKKEAKTFNPKQILLTLTKDPGHCCMTAVMEPIGKTRELKILGKKLIKINTKDGNDVSLKKLYNTEIFNTGYKSLPKITQVPMANRQSLLYKNPFSILKSAPVSESVVRQKYRNNFYERRRTSNRNNTVIVRKDLGVLENKGLASALNKQDRFVPNILRSTRMAENNFNNNNIIRYNSTQTMGSHGRETHCTNYKNVKERKRKQVLSTLNIKHDWTRRARILRMKNGLNKSLLRIRNHLLHEESRTETQEFTPKNAGQEDNEKCPEMKPEDTAAVDEVAVDFGEPNDLYTANLDIPKQTHNLPTSTEKADFNNSIDKSIKQIFTEFEVADYQNYIDCEDLRYGIDENDLYSANLDIPKQTHNLPTSTEKADFNSSVDKSIKQIFTEFEVADYQNYIDCEDLRFDIDKNDLYSANLDIPKQTHNLPTSTEKADFNSSVDKSIKQIFTEFEVADYQNYIDCEDLRFDIDKNDLYSANLDIPKQTHNLPTSTEKADFNSSVDKSIKQIFTEFEVADYQNYIDCEDLRFDIDENDLYTANLDIPKQTHNLPTSTEKADFNSGVDKSIKQIFTEFEVADYQNYIDCEDLCFDIDEMDKLLSADVDGLLTELSDLDNAAKIVGYDVNGNDVDNHGNALQKSTDENEPKPNMQCKVESCYEDRAEQVITSSGRLNCDINPDAICSARGCTTSKTNLWSTEFQDYCSSCDFKDFHRSFEQDLSSTDTASECDTDEPNPTQSLSLVVPKIANLECFETSLAVSDVLPDNVLSEDSNEIFHPTMQQCHVNFGDNNGNNYYSSLPPDLSVERFTSDMVLHDGFDASCDLVEDGNFLIDNMLNANFAVFKEDETCESILANTNAKFDDINVLKMLSNVSDFDIENADDLEISRLLRLGNIYSSNFSSLPHDAPQPCVLNAPESQLNMDMADQSNANSISISNYDNSQFGSMKFENPIQTQAENTLDQFRYSNSLEGFKFLFKNEVETETQECSIGDSDFKLSNSALVNILSGSEELLLPCDPEADDIDSKELSSQCSPPLLIERTNLDELETSELPSLPTGTQTCEIDYPIGHCLPALSSDVTDSKIADKRRSEIVKHPKFDIFDSTISSHESYHSHENGHNSIEDTLYPHAAQERNMTAGQGTVIDLDAEYNVADRRNYHLSELDLLYEQQSYNCESMSYSVSLKEPASAAEKLPVNLSKPKRGSSTGLWTELVKRNKSVTPNISYIPCDFCEKKIRSEAALVRHMRVTHQFKLSRFRYRNKKYVCDKCSKEYCMAGAIEKHFKLHENYSLTCRVCEKHFSEKIYLRRHVQSSHFHWKLQCSYCGQKFSRTNALTRHLKCHDLRNFYAESIGKLRNA